MVKTSTIFGFHQTTQSIPLGHSVARPRNAESAPRPTCSIHPHVTGVLLTYERTVGKRRTVGNNIDNSQESRTGVNACSIRTKL